LGRNARRRKNYFHPTKVMQRITSG
jgi:hypothetical protein